MSSSGRLSCLSGNPSEDPCRSCLLLLPNQPVALDEDAPDLRSVGPGQEAGSRSDQRRVRTNSRRRSHQRGSHRPMSLERGTENDATTPRPTAGTVVTPRFAQIRSETPQRYQCAGGRHCHLRVGRGVGSGRLGSAARCWPPTSQREIVGMELTFGFTRRQRRRLRRGVQQSSG